MELLVLMLSYIHRIITYQNLQCMVQYALPEGPMVQDDNAHTERRASPGIHMRYANWVIRAPKLRMEARLWPDRTQGHGAVDSKTLMEIVLW
jgi:hypothetical protein